MIGVSGTNVVPHVAEEYNVVIAPAHTRSLAETVALATHLKSKSATWSHAVVSWTFMYT